MNINFINTPTIGLKIILIKNTHSVPGLLSLEIFSETIKEPIYQRINMTMTINSFIRGFFRNKK